MAALLSKGALALFAFTAFASSATGPLTASASDIEIDSERQHRLRGQEVKDSIQVDSARRLGRLGLLESWDFGSCPDDQKLLEAFSDEPARVDIFDMCGGYDPFMTGSVPGTNAGLSICVPKGRYGITFGVSDLHSMFTTWVLYDGAIESHEQSILTTTNTEVIYFDGESETGRQMVSYYQIIGTVEVGSCPTPVTVTTKYMCANDHPGHDYICANGDEDETSECNEDCSWNMGTACYIAVCDGNEVA